MMVNIVVVTLAVPLFKCNEQNHKLVKLMQNDVSNCVTLCVSLQYVLKWEVENGFIGVFPVLDYFLYNSCRYVSLPFFLHCWNWILMSYCGNRAASATPARGDENKMICIEKTQMVADFKLYFPASLSAFESLFYFSFMKLTLILATLALWLHIKFLLCVAGGGGIVQLIKQTIKHYSTLQLEWVFKACFFMAVTRNVKS